LVIGYSVVMTFIIIKVMRIFTPLTIDHAAAEAGIDTHLHGEQVSSVLSMGQTGSTAKG
jgi:ammonia channel protein AmtB